MHHHMQTCGVQSINCKTERHYVIYHLRKCRKKYSYKRENGVHVYLVCIIFIGLL